MATRASALTYADLLAMPEDNVRRELFDGELVVSPSPNVRHQEVVIRLGRRLLDHADATGGLALAAPTDTWFTDTRVLQPDVLALGPETLARQTGERPIVGPPDLVVEVSSPSGRHHPGAPRFSGRRRAGGRRGRTPGTCPDVRSKAGKAGDSSAGIG